MPPRRGLLAPQNTFLDTIATRFDGTHSNFVLGNAQVPSLYPIVYCSDGFCELTGFQRAQIMQKSCACKFLYGPETQEEQKLAIELTLESKAELKTEVKFYKKNGTAFWCLLDVVPIKNEKRDVVLFLASHKDVTHTKLEESVDDDLSNEDNEDYDPEDPPSNYGRRRSRAVLYQLSGHYKPDKAKNKLKINNTLLQPRSAGPLPEYKTASIKKSKFILSHYGTFKGCWDFIILLATVYIAVAVPYNAAFLSNIEQSENPTILPGVLVEVLFFIDICFNFRTTFVNKKGEVVLNPKKIVRNYVKGWFVLDLIAAMPLDFLLATGVISSTMSFHMLKLTRLLRLARILQKIDRYSQYSALILTLLMLFFALVSHWLACIWYAIARDSVEAPGWIFELGERLHMNATELDVAEKYVTALYFTCSSLTSVGFGNVSANTLTEKIFSIISMLIGALMHATVFGNVTSIIQRMYSRRSLYQTKWRDLKDFLSINQIPKELRNRMKDFFQTMWSINQGIDIQETLKEFPEELRGDVSMHIHREILSLPIFESAAQGCLKMLSLHIRNIFCAPGEFLVHRGDALQYIYYLCNGSMEVVMGDMVVAILGKGDLVGSDVDMYLQNGSETLVKSSCDVKALTYCDLKSASISGLVDVLKLYPEYQQEFANDIKHDLTHNLREGYDTEKDVDVNSAKNALPSISEDDEERGSDDDDQKSPLSASPRHDDDTFGSPRWNYRNRDRQPRVDRLKALAKPRLHRSTDELRGGICDDNASRLHLEKLDTQVNTLHSDVSTLTREVRSALQVLQCLGRGSQDISTNKSGYIGGVRTVPDEICSSAAFSLDISRHITQLTRSSPSIFVTTDESHGSGLNIVNGNAASPLQRKASMCSVSIQTETDLDIPVEVFEEYLIANREKVLDILGVSEELCNYSHNYPVAKNYSDDVNYDVTSTASEDIARLTNANSKDIYLVKRHNSHTSRRRRNANVLSAPSKTIDLSDWEDEKLKIVLSQSAGSMGEAAASPRAAVANYHKNNRSFLISRTKSNAENQSVIHKYCSQDCPPNNLICFEEINFTPHSLTRSTSLPVRPISPNQKQEKESHRFSDCIKRL